MRDLDYLFVDLDVRLSVNLLLEFLDQFEEPPISSKTILMIYEFITRESPDFVNIFQNNEINKSMEKHEFYILDELVKFGVIIFKDASQLALIKNYFLRISISLLKKVEEYPVCFSDNSLNLKRENLDIFNKDEIMKKLRQIFWLWFEEIRTIGENQINEIEESFKSVSSPLLVKKKHINENSKKRAKTESGKTKFFSLRQMDDNEEEKEEKKE